MCKMSAYSPMSEVNGMCWCESEHRVDTLNPSS